MLLSLVLAAALATDVPSPSVRARTRTDRDLAGRLLLVHNRTRAAVGAPPLAWDEGLAVSAASYGPRLAALGRLVHSPRADRPGQRENLARDIVGRGTPESLAQLWVDERGDFVPGVFPSVTRTARWEDVGHYTQMIWPTTTHFGCALHDEKGWRYLICRYSPPGNRDGIRIP